MPKAALHHPLTDILHRTAVDCSPSPQRSCQTGLQMYFSGYFALIKPTQVSAMQGPGAPARRRVGKPADTVELESEEPGGDSSKGSRRVAGMLGVSPTIPTGP